MRIGLYGMPAAGKSHIMDQVDFMDVYHGSSMLHQYDQDFECRDALGREKGRKAIAKMLLEKDEFIMDGHYAFGDDLAFTEEDGTLYDTILYLFIDPQILKKRMSESAKNHKYLVHDIDLWQKHEINALRAFCHQNNKDFHVIDNPPENCFNDVSLVVDFIRDIKKGYSCVAYARESVATILQRCSSNEIFLLDGDKTLIVEDSSNLVFGYTTHLYDGNFYTGYQSWKQNKEFAQYTVPDIKELPVRFNDKVLSQIGADSFILTSGHEKVWRFISDYLQRPFFFGTRMSAETKFFITKFLQEAGKTVIAYGDGMNDYFMMKQADIGYLVPKQNGTVSRSLRDRDLEGLIRV